MVVKYSVDRKTALQECVLDVTKLDRLLSSSNEDFIVQSWETASMSVFFIWGVKEKMVASHSKVYGFMWKHDSSSHNVMGCAR